MRRWLLVTNANTLAMTVQANTLTISEHTYRTLLNLEDVLRASVYIIVYINKHVLKFLTGGYAECSGSDVAWRGGVEAAAHPSSRPHTDD